MFLQMFGIDYQWRI